MLRFPKGGMPALRCFLKPQSPAAFVSGLHSRIAVQHIASRQRRLPAAAIGGRKPWLPGKDSAGFPYAKKSVAFQR